MYKRQTGFSNDFLNAGTQHCRVTHNLSPASVWSWEIDGLDALEFNGCPACADIEAGLGSLRPPWGATFSAPVTNQTSLTNTGGNTWENQSGADGEGFSLQEDLQGDGVFLTAQFTSNAGNGARSCLEALRIYLPVEVTCDGTTGDFISATDAAGNTYTEAEVEF